MINLTRFQRIPESLKSSRANQYKVDLSNHLLDPITYSKPQPSTDIYASEDVLDAFEKRFPTKCYLTEQWYADMTLLEVDHFIPCDQDPSLAYDWHNLFPCDPNANRMKLARNPINGYLNPCKDDVESALVQSLMLDEPIFSAVDVTNLKAVATAELLNHLHNGENKQHKSYRKTKHLRYLIMKKKDEVMNALTDWLGYPANSIEKAEAEIKLRNLLSRTTSFTMLMRSLPSVKLHVPATFLD